MRKKIITVICCIVVAIIIAAVTFSALFRDNTVSAEGDNKFKMSLLHVYAESDNLISVLPFTTIQLTQQAIIKAFKDDVYGAINFLDTYVERTVVASYDNMTAILEKYDALLTKYNITGTYRTKYTTLQNDFNTLKTSANTLVTRAKSLINNVNASSYSTHYNQYMSQLDSLSTSTSACLNRAQAEYELLFTAVVSSGTSDAKLKTELLDWYEKADDIVTILPFTTIQVTQQALVMALKGDTTDATEYLNQSIDRTLDSAYKTMDGILEGYTATLNKYQVSASSSYRTKLKTMGTYFQSLKSSGDNLIARTKSLIKVVDNDTFPDYYTQYMSQLEDFYTKMENYLTKLQNEYDTLLSSLSADYAILK